MKSSAFKKGNVIATGGKREGSGRKPDAFKHRALFLLAKYNLLERLAKIAAGENVDVTHSITGQAFPSPAPMAAQVSACRELLDRGLGKSVQSVDVSGQIANSIIVTFKDKPNTTENK